MQFPRIIGLRRSRFLDAMLVLAAILAGGAIVNFQTSMAMQICLSAVLVIVTIHAWQALKPEIQSIRLERNGEVFLLRVGEIDYLIASPEPKATIHPWLSVIRLTTEDGRRSTLIATVDSLKGADFRGLRIFMRWQATFNEPSDDA
ncbi:MAG: hypothetical protein JNJ95_07240 [Dechloromonas sp.]|nr:hypothetical protein [Dechloromonas sp.]